jgi:type IV fimbrial biogenesis protein FimT
VLTIVPKKPAVGFSLIELIIAIAIVGLVSAIAMPSYVTWIKNSRVRTAAESIQNGLQTARAEAVKRNASIRFSLSANSNWSIGCVTTSSNCPATILSRFASEGATGGATITLSPDGTDFPAKATFSNLGLLDNTTTPAPFNQVDISFSGADRPLRVTLGVGGNTRLCDPKTTLAATDPRRC